MATDFDVTDASGKTLTLVSKALVLCEQAGLKLVVMLLKDAFMMLEEGEEMEGGVRKRKTHSFVVCACLLDDHVPCSGLKEILAGACDERSSSISPTGQSRLT